MRERPILFSAPMVRALLAGTKTQTRRAWRVQPPPGVQVAFVPGETRCPYGQPGDRLWVRESHWWFKDEHDPVTGYFPPPLTIEDVEYRADGEKPGRSWRPSIHMPRWASRITLEVTGVRVERLQGISEADALAEGLVPTHGGYGLPDGSHFHAADPRVSYWSLWDAINGPGSVEANPLVWCVEFRRLP